MGGGRAEINKDNQPLSTGTHKGVNDTDTLVDTGQMFDIVVAQTGLMIENVTKGYRGLISAITPDTIAVDWAIGGGGNPLTFGSDVLGFGSTVVSFGPYNAWSTGDTYAVYKTATKNAEISRYMTDVSKGWKADPLELQRGWFAEDWDLNRNLDGGTFDVFGPGQPTRN